MKNVTKRLIRWAIAIVLILLIPLVLTIRDGGVEGVGWNWTLFDFIFMGTLMFGAALVYELVSRKMTNGTYRAAVGVAVVTGLVLIWINGAVGIIGSENNPVNLMYFGVLIVGLIGAIITRLQPRGMSRTLFAVALAQFLVPVIAFIFWKPDFAPGAVQVFSLNMFFVVLFTGSALLFRRASTTSSK
jgi:hypothetical protein